LEQEVFNRIAWKIVQTLMRSPYIVGNGQM
jgi:hypothetical protein